MSALQTKLIGASFPSTFPRAYPDPMMSDGTLLLWDPSHPDGLPAGTATTPANASTMFNLAWRESSLILGAGDSSTLALPVARAAGISADTSSKHKVEWTLKKGLHVIVSQNPGMLANESLGFELPVAIRDYIFANTPGKTFYISIWSRLTRNAISGSVPQAKSYMALNDSTYAWKKTDTGAAALTFLGGGTDKFSSTPQGNVLGNHYDSIGLSAWGAGTKPATVPTTRIWNVGPAGPFSSANLLNSPSNIIYRIYVEELTGSRTFAVVKALDEAAYTAAFASGGVFFGDTFTDPTTIP